MAPLAAEATLLATQARQQRILRQGRRPSTLLELQAFTARYWLEDSCFAYPRCQRRNRRAEALTSLVIGQLLMTRRLCGAMEHLDRGFELATPLFRPDDYFRVLERHTLFRLLPLTPKGHPPADLDTLLTAARIAERLGARPAAVGHQHDPNDLYG